MDTIDLDHKRKISDQILLLLLVTHFQRLTKKNNATFISCTHYTRKFRFVAWIYTKIDLYRSIKRERHSHCHCMCAVGLFTDKILNNFLSRPVKFVVSKLKCHYILIISTYQMFISICWKRVLTNVSSSYSRRFIYTSWFRLIFIPGQIAIN